MLIKFLLSGKEINLTSDNMSINSTNFNVDKNGNMTCQNATITGGKINIETSRNLGDKIFILKDDMGAYSYVGTVNACIGYDGSDIDTGVYLQGTKGGSSVVRAQVITQTSLEKYKKNFEKLDNALEILKQIEIYKYNLKVEKDTDKKHLGFVIGDKYKYAKEVTNKDDTGVDDYSFISLCCKAIQEQQQIIEELKARVEKLEQKAGEA